MSLVSPYLPWEKFLKAHSLLGVGCVVAEQAFRLTVTEGIGRTRLGGGEGKRPTVKFFKCENIFLKIQCLCEIGVDITDLLS